METVDAQLNGSGNQKDPSHLENMGKRHSNIDVLKSNVLGTDKMGEMRANKSLKDIKRNTHRASNDIAPITGYGPVLRNNRLKDKLHSKRSMVVNGSFNQAREEFLKKYRLNNSNSPNHDQSMTKGETVQHTTETGSVGNRFSTIQFED